MARFAKFLPYLHRAENGLLVALVLALICLAAAQILARFFFSGGWLFIDPLSRMLVLWTGMLGALVAAREDKHISLDALTRSIKNPGLLKLLRALTLGFAAAVSLLFAWHSMGLIELDYGSGEEVFAGMPAWAAESILPIGFGLLGLRFLVRAFSPPRTHVA